MNKKKSKRGFAAMSLELRRKIAASGGRAAQAGGKTHKWTKQEAKEAGKKGGQAAAASGKAHRFTSETGKAAVRKRQRRPK